MTRMMPPATLTLEPLPCEPFRKTGEAFAAVSLVSELPPVLQVHPSLGVTSSARSVVLPELPTIAESASPCFDAISWIGWGSQ